MMKHNIKTHNDIVSILHFCIHIYFVFLTIVVYHVCHDVINLQLYDVLGMITIKVDFSCTCNSDESLWLTTCS